MKKWLYVLPGLCLCASAAVAEQIDSVTFNPARLGRYETLKVSDKLTTRGGVQTQAVTVQSGGTVSLNNNGNFQIGDTSVKGSVYMPNTRFVADKLESKGTARFVNTASSAQSDITLLNTASARVRANMLEMGGVSVSGESALDYDGNGVSGFTLGENNIPKADASCQNLQWVTRQGISGDKSYTYKVLGFGSCSTTGDPTKCTPATGLWNTPTTAEVADTCPGNDKINEYNCNGNFEGTCTDAMRAMVLFTQQGTVTYEADKTTTDTCDGNVAMRATSSSNVKICPSSTCRDVYVAGVKENSVESTAAFEFYCYLGHAEGYGGDIALMILGEKSVPSDTKIVYGRALSTSNNYNDADVACAEGNGAKRVILTEGTSTLSCKTPEDDGKRYYKLYRVAHCNGGEYKYEYQNVSCTDRFTTRQVTCCKN